MRKLIIVLLILTVICEIKIFCQVNNDIKIESKCLLVNRMIKLRIHIMNSSYEQIFVPISYWNFITFFNKEDSASNYLNCVNQLIITAAENDIHINEALFSSFNGYLPLFISIKPNVTKELLFYFDVNDEIIKIIKAMDMKIFINMNYCNKNNFNEMIKSNQLKRHKLIINESNYYLHSNFWDTSKYNSGYLDFKKSPYPPKTNIDCLECEENRITSETKIIIEK